MNFKTFASLGSLMLMTLACGGPEQDQDSETFVALKPSVISSTNIYTTLAKPFLNCRAQAGTSRPVVFELRAGSVLDVVSKTTVNANGFVWIQVNPRGDSDHNDCWVAADDRYLKPSNSIDAPLLSLNQLYAANVFQVKANLACRQQPSQSAPVIFDLRSGIVLDKVATEFGPAWADQSYWILVNPRGDTDHNDCWVPGLKAALTPQP